MEPYTTQTNPVPPLRQQRMLFFHEHWNVFYERLVQYKEAHGTVHVPESYPDDPELAAWCDLQRFWFRRDSLNEESLSTSICTGDPTPAEDQCTAADSVASKTCSSKLITGSNEVGTTATSVTDTSIPTPFDREATHQFLLPRRRQMLQSLGFWQQSDGDSNAGVVRTRRPAERTAKLASMAKEENKKRFYKQQWDQTFDRLVAFNEVHKHCLVPKRYPDDPKLGTWVETQRVQHKKLMKKQKAQLQRTKSVETYSDDAAQRLTDERIRRLEDLGFVWSLRDDWQKRYDELKQFKSEHKHCLVPVRYTKNRRLGTWVSAQRTAFKMANANPSTSRVTSLTKERVDLLNEVGFVWVVRGHTRALRSEGNHASFEVDINPDT